MKHHVLYYTNQIYIVPYDFRQLNFKYFQDPLSSNSKNFQTPFCFSGSLQGPPQKIILFKKFQESVAGVNVVHYVSKNIPDILDCNLKISDFDNF